MRSRGEDSSTTRLLQTINIGVAALFAIWGGSLLRADDYDGAMHAAGVFMLGVAAVLALPSTLLLLRDLALPERATHGWFASLFLELSTAAGTALLLLWFFG